MDDSGRIWSKLAAVATTASIPFLAFGAVLILVSVVLFERRRPVGRGILASWAVCVGLLLIGIAAGLGEVRLCSKGRHEFEALVHWIVIASLFAQFFSSAALVANSRGRRLAAAFGALGMVVLQFAVFLTFDITLNGFG